LTGVDITENGNFWGMTSSMAGGGSITIKGSGFDEDAASHDVYLRTTSITTDAIRLLGNPIS
jgi:hypothetical protein